MINILHTSDWHLGKKLYKYERRQEHELFLEWLESTIEKEKIDVLLVAGDIFDSPTPPNYAQKMFYDFIYRLEKFPDLTTVVIAGNHDSASLLDIPKYFFERARCHLHSYMYEDPQRNEIFIEKNDIKIGIKTLPYFRNFELINMLNDQSVEEFFQNRFSEWSEGQIDHRVLVAHHGFGVYSSAGSEHAIFLSGLDYFPLEWIKPNFDYAALGHIHKKQTLCEEPPIIYPGSPIPLRFSESNKKTVSLFKVGKTQRFQKYIDIPVFRKLVRVKGDQTDYLRKLAEQLESIDPLDLDAYLEVEITLKEAVSGMADNIRQFIEKKNIELVSYRPIVEFYDEEKSDLNSLDQLNVFELFEQYYLKKFPDVENIPTEILEEFKTLVEETRQISEKDVDLVNGEENENS